MDLSELKREAANGRGLWVGLFIPSYPKIDHPLADWLPEDAHVTLVHLGKGRDPDDVDALAEVTQSVWSMHYRPLMIELTGCGWFCRKGPETLVALVNSAQLFAMRALMSSQLGDRRVFPNDQFGFIPHITLRTRVNDAPVNARDLATELRRMPRYNVEIPTITVVCGDATVSLS